MLPPIHTCPSGLVWGAVRLVRYLGKPGALGAISKQVRFTRRRFGHYEVIDWSIGPLRLCGQWRTDPGCLYERLRPWANAFMALSRWLAGLTVEPVEALRAFPPICWHAN